MEDTDCPKRMNWFLLGAVWGLFAAPVLGVLLDTKVNRRMRGAR